MYTKSGVNKKTEELLMGPIPYTPADIEKKKKTNQLYSVVNLYTMYRDKFFKSFLLTNKFSNITHDTNYEHYKDELFDFRFQLFSDMIEGNSKMIKNLRSNKRYHRCHEASIGMSLNDEIGEIKILTGYFPSANKAFHHSVIEINQDGNEYIIDYTQNLFILKDDYINLYGFRVVNEVSSKDLKKDLDIMVELGIRTPFYLFFRDEIVKDLKKNNKVLKLED